MTRFIFVRVGAFLLIITVAVLVARFFILQSLNCKPVCINVSLIGRDLRNLDLRKVDFTEANLQRSDLGGADLRWTDFSGARLSNTTLTDTDLRGAKLIGADLRSADLRGAKLNGADLSGAVLDRADLTQLDLTETKLRGVSFIGSKLVEANLSQVVLAGIDFSSADLSGADLTGANLAGTSLSGANLSGAILVQTDIAGSWLNLTNLTGADMTGSDLSGSSMMGANLASARLFQARLTGANLVGASFLGTDLRAASLQGIRLVVSELQPQDLEDPLLANMNDLQRSEFVVDAKLRGVQYDDKTQWPSGKLVLLAGLLGQEFADAVAAQQVAEPTPEPTPTIEESAILSATTEIIGQPEATGPAISIALSGPGGPLSKSIYDLFQSQGYTDTIGFRDVETSNAIALFCGSGEVDAILLSRTMTSSELESCAASGHELLSLQVGTVALVVIVDPSNAFVTDLTFSEIPLLITAEKWSDIRPDWPSELILRFLPTPGSGALSFLSANFFAGSESDPVAAAPNTLFNPDEIQLVQAIATTPFAAGFFGLNYYSQNAEILKLVTIDGVTPNTETVSSGVYTLTQPLLLYSDLARVGEKPELGYFLWSYLDTVGSLIERAGFVASNPEVMDANRAALDGIPNSGPSEIGDREAGQDPTATQTPAAPGATDPGATPTITTTSLITETIMARLTTTATPTIAPKTPVAEEAQPTATPTSGATVTATAALTTPVPVEGAQPTGTPASGATVTATAALTTPVPAEEAPQPTGTPTSP
jgi:uncharacterized protein YjbI with pentapeptide repeats/ABC-type phosphate transport system substrate-binding protein